MSKVERIQIIECVRTHAAFNPMTRNKSFVSTSDKNMFMLKDQEINDLENSITLPIDNLMPMTTHVIETSCNVGI